MNDCVNCGNGCCFDINFPEQLQCQACCGGCCKDSVTLPPNYCVRRGDVLVPVTGNAEGVGAEPNVFKKWNETATDGTALAYDMVIAVHDAQTGSDGKIHFGIGCGKPDYPVYLCGIFNASEINVDYRKLRAAGAPISVVNNKLILR